MQLRMKTLIFLEFTEKSNFQGGEEFTKKQYIEGNCLKGEYGQFTDLRRFLARKTGG